jgi:cystathionine gamma-synthase
VNPPVQLSTTFAQPTPGEPGRFEYARSGNETRAAFEEAVATLEGAATGFAFASGLAAVDAVVRATTAAGQTVLVGTDAYGGTHRLLSTGYTNFGVDCVVAHLADPAAVAAAGAGRDVALVWVETPSNPRLGVVDLAALARVARSMGALVVVDNTFATPYLQQPLAWGADVVVHSATKYLAGHSDVVGGAAVTSHPHLADRIGWVQNAAGAVLAPFDSYLALRGVRTLAVRMDRACDNAEAVVAALARRSDVAEVFYPGRGGGESERVARAQMRRRGAMVAFRPTGGAARAVEATAALTVFTVAESLGAVESLACVPARMTHASVAGTELEVPDDLIRLSVGIEDVDDLITDLAAALDATK